MSYQGNTLITITTASSVTRGEFVSGAGTLSATLPPIGVCYDIDGTDCIVAISGTVLVEAGATFVIGAALTSDANGHAVTATIGTDHVAAIAMEAATAAGQLVLCRLV